MASRTNTRTSSAVASSLSDRNSRSCEEKQGGEREEGGRRRGREGGEREKEGGGRERRREKTDKDILKLAV